MKQQYLIAKNEAKKELIIREFAELDKELLSLLCEETYSADAIKSAISEGEDALIAALRTPNMYPISTYVKKIAVEVVALYKKKGDQSTEIFFNDMDLVAPLPEKKISVEDIEPEDEEIDELLTEDADENLTDDLAVDKIKSAIKIADDDSTIVDNDGE